MITKPQEHVPPAQAPEVLVSEEVKPKEMVDLQLGSFDKDTEFLTLNLPNLKPAVKISMKSLAEMAEAGIQIQKDAEQHARDSQDWCQMKNLILHAIEGAVTETQQLGEMIVEDPILQEHLSGLHPRVARAAQ